MHISKVLNVQYLHKYHGENTSLRSNFHQLGKPDTDQLDIWSESDSLWLRVDDGPHQLMTDF
jgi:hypothetical protein